MFTAEVAYRCYDNIAYTARRMIAIQRYVFPNDHTAYLTEPQRPQRHPEVCQSAQWKSKMAAKAAWISTI